MEHVEFPPIDDMRWDRLLGAVLAQPPTVPFEQGPLATPFPSPVASEERREAREPATIVLDSYA